MQLRLKIYNTRIIVFKYLLITVYILHFGFLAYRMVLAAIILPIDRLYCKRNIHIIYTGCIKKRYSNFAML